MSLFFYGLIDCAREPGAELLRRVAKPLGIPLEFDTLTAEHSLFDLFGNVDGLHNPLQFEVEGTPEKDAYEFLYGSYDGNLMTEHYRALARSLGVSGWQTLEFGSRPEVDEAYKATPYPLPVVTFVTGLLDALPRSKAVIAFDHNFENQSECDDVSGGRDFVINQVWGTIAFGYQFPNVRIRYQPISAER